MNVQAGQPAICVNELNNGALFHVDHFGGYRPDNGEPWWWVTPMQDVRSRTRGWVHAGRIGKIEDRFLRPLRGPEVPEEVTKQQEQPDLQLCDVGVT